MGFFFSHATSVFFNKEIYLNYMESFMKSFIRTVAPIALMIFSSFVHAGPVDINSASAEQLAAELNGIGEARAKAIVAYRAAHGPFVSVDSLLEVKGVGERIVEVNRANILLGK